jgi:glyoxylase-like metal-dependent hydrolase (beta-lactamase superfamily II)
VSALNGAAILYPVSGEKGDAVILRRLVVGPLASNCYIAGSEATKEGMIIDPADEAERILTNVTQLGLEIKLILLTHGHPDHVGALKGVQEATGAEVVIHTDDTEALLNQPLAFAFGPTYPSPSPPDRLLNGGESLNIGDLHFSVRHTPGHTPGGICLLRHNVLFSGDTLFNYGIGRFDMPGGNYEQLMNSLAALFTSLPDDTAVYPGHGPETTIGTERQANPFLQG